ncbi:glycosyltransferase family 2 protein [Eggerthella lenta]|nr:glycosyltransferase family 2 protein [Eggerthella lenta]
MASIIVPVYNVASYLDTCVESIICQDWADMEILLVDDGSTDGCDELCDAWAEKDDRVRSYHKPNGGLSSARGFGLDRSRGRYVMFVDSDDWVECSLVGELIEALERNDADVSVCSYVKHKNGGSYPHCIGGDRVYTSSEALFEVVRDESLNNFAWGILCKKTLYDEIGYPRERRKFEDVAFTYQLFRQASKIVHIDRPLYHYRRRDDSILGTWSLDVALALVVAHQDRYADLSQTTPELIQPLLESYYSVFRRAKKNTALASVEQVKGNSDTIRIYLKRFYEENRKTLEEAVQLSVFARFGDAVFLAMPCLYRRLAKTARRCRYGG